MGLKAKEVVGPKELTKDLFARSNRKRINQRRGYQGGWGRQLVGFKADHTIWNFTYSGPYQYSLYTPIHISSLIRATPSPV